MEMVAEVKVLTVHQVCDKCGYKKNYNVSYPYQRMVPIEVLREPVGREIARSE